MKIIVADNSTLIALLDTNNFSLLFKLFEEIIIAKQIYDEIIYNQVHRDTIEHYIFLDKIKLQNIEEKEMYELLLKRLDAGESASIVLAKTLQLPLIIDEKKGRSIAKSLGIPIIGLVGLILKLIQKKIISKKEALEIVNNIEKNNFRLSKELKNLIYSFEG